MQNFLYSVLILLGFSLFLANASTNLKQENSSTTSSIAGKNSVDNTFDLKCDLLSTLIKAYKNNQSLQEKQKEVLSNHEKIVQALAAFRPSITLDSGLSKRRTNLSGDTKEAAATAGSARSDKVSRYAEVTLTQNLFAGGQHLAAYTATDYSMQSLWASLLSSEQEVLLQAVQSFLEVWSKEAAVNVHQSNVLSMQQNHKVAYSKMVVGEETKTQVMQAEAKLAGALANLSSAMAELQAARSSYQQIVGEAAPQKCIEPKIRQDFSGKLENLIKEAEEFNPTIISTRFDHLASQKEQDRITGALMPKVDFVAKTTREESRTTGYTRSSRSNANTFSNDYSMAYEVGVKMSMPLYDGGSIRSQRRQAIADSVKKRVGIEKTKQQIVSQLQQSWANYQAAKHNIKLLNTQIKSATVALSSTQEEQRAGSKVMLDVLNAQNDLMQAKLQYINNHKVLILESYKISLCLGKLTAQHLQLPVEYFDPKVDYAKVKKNW